MMRICGVAVIMLCAMLVITGVALAKPTSWEMDNGLTVIMEENHLVDIVALEVFQRGGVLYEEEENAGITRLLARSLDKGTKYRDAAEIAAAFDDLGAALSVQLLPDMTCVSLRAPGETFLSALAILAEILIEPVFPQKEIERERALLIEDIRRSRDEPFVALYDSFRETFYRDHPYRLAESGGEEAVSTLTREDLVDFYRRHWVGENTVISLVGNFETELMREKLTEYFSAMSEVSAPEFLSLPEKPPSQIQRVAEDVAMHSSWLMVGYPAPPADHPDYAAMRVINALLGHGGSSRLFLEVRGRRGLAYSAFSFYPTRMHPSHLASYAVVEPGKEEEALRAMQKVIEGLKEELVKEGEIARARNIVIGEHLLAQETRAGRAWRLGWMETMSRGYDYVDTLADEAEDVDAQVIQRVAREYFNVPSIVVRGPGGG